MSLFRRILSYGGLIAVLFLTTIGPASASTNAYGSKFITSITYMNIGTTAANLSVQFIDNTGSGTPINYPILNNDGSARTLASNASASLAVSVLDASTSTWDGGAIISANQPLATTIVQVSTNPTIRVRPVSNGFTASDAGATVSLPYVAKACGTTRITSRINIQNVGASGNIVTTLRWPSGVVAYTQTDTAVPTGGIISIDMGSVTVSGTTPTTCAAGGFEGSATITGPNIVATSFEASTTGRNAATYEGIVTPRTSGTNFIEMPSALCNVNYGDGAQSSSIVLHNPGATNAAINITYRFQIRETNGALGAIQTRVTTSKPIAANRTLTVNACDDNVPARAVGAAIINTNGATAVTAISKITGNGVYAVAPGLPRPTSGSTVVYAPYVRYSTSCFTAAPTNAVCRNESRQRTLFSVHNTSGSPIRVRMTLYNSLGVAVGTPYLSPSIPANAKISIGPTDVTAVATAPNNEFGYWVIGGNIVYGGSAKFESWQPSSNAAATVPIAVTVRVLNNTVLGQTAEDYNGIAE